MRLSKTLLGLAIASLLLLSCSTENTPVYTLSTSANPSEAGSVTPAQGEYDEGEEIQLTATPNENWVFNGWLGDQTGSDNPVTISMDSDKSITASFNKRKYPLTINIEGEGTVDETVILQKTTNYDHGTTIELTATPTTAWEFVEWQGDLSGNLNPAQIQIDGNRSVTAVFQEAEYEINIELQGEGSITLNPEKPVYEHGDQVEISVVPADDWNFVYWDGDLEGTEEIVTISVTQDINAKAILDNSPFAGGDGSEMYPYEVSTVQQLQAVRNHSDKHFIQINDIDASETENWNNGQGFIPIGDELIPFSGHYYGSGYTIENLFIDYSDEGGLFGYITMSGIVQNTHIRNFDMGVEQSGVFAKENAGKIIECSVVGDVLLYRINYFISGFVDVNSGLIRRSYFNGTLEGEWSTSGIARVNQGNGVIEDSYSIGSIRNSRRAAGLVIGNYGTIKNSHSLMNVVSDRYSGGLVSLNEGDILNSYSTGDVSSAFVAGGLVSENISSGVIENSYSLGNVSGDEKIGGLVGVNQDDAKILNSFSTGTVIGNSDTGASIGVNVAQVNGAFWNIDNANINAVGRGSSSNIISLNTSQMQGSAAKDNMPEFDWENVWKTVDGDYPILRWQEE
jgi:uncharacterized repeat protein (TIGR02543 family)